MDLQDDALMSAEQRTYLGSSGESRNRAPITRRSNEVENTSYMIGGLRNQQNSDNANSRMDGQSRQSFGRQSNLVYNNDTSGVTYYDASTRDPRDTDSEYYATESEDSSRLMSLPNSPRRGSLLPYTRVPGKSLLIYICNFHVLSHLLLIYICKLHWNLNTMFVCQVNSF